MGRWRNCHIYRQSRRAKIKCDIKKTVEAIYQIRVWRSSRTLGRQVYMAARRCGPAAVLLESLRRCRAAGKSADSDIQEVSRWETPVCQSERLTSNILAMVVHVSVIRQNNIAGTFFNRQIQDSLHFFKRIMQGSLHFFKRIKSVRQAEKYPGRLLEELFRVSDHSSRQIPVGNGFISDIPCRRTLSCRTESHPPGHKGLCGQLLAQSAIPCCLL